MPRARNPCSYLPRRLQIVASFAGFILFAIFFLGSSAPSDPLLDKIPYGPQLEKGAHEVLEHVPFADQINPFGDRIHKPPPEQRNSSSGDIRWFSDFKWKNPFSSSTTLDEERAVLPPLRDRPRVYTYFDPATRRKDETSRRAEQDLLQIWRRAWWAHGFSPIVLGRAEATNNPYFRRIEAMTLEPELDLEMMRWLAWDNMGTGILCNWLALPMGDYNDPLLSFLRRGRFPALTRYEKLENGLFVGNKDSIDKTIKTVIGSAGNLTGIKSVYEAVPREMFDVDDKHSVIAFYSLANIALKYPNIGTRLDNPDSRAQGLAMMPKLINSHLHATWQSRYPSGISVLKPISKNTTSLVEPALKLAKSLSQCSDTPLPASCPPNIVRCRPCVSTQEMRVQTPQVYKNTTAVFTIGTVPHPYTLQSLMYSRSNLDLAFVRRNTSRDVWIMAATKELLGSAISSFDRLAPFKNAVASERGMSHTYWITGEHARELDTEKELDELDWIFGFQIPRQPLAPHKSDNPVPSLNRHPPSTSDLEKQMPDAQILALQRSLLENSTHIIGKGEKNSKDKAAVRIRTIVEAWNLADTEAWKFVRAWNARRVMERKRWEAEEAQFIGKAFYERFRDLVNV